MRFWILFFSSLTFFSFFFVFSVDALWLLFFFFLGFLFSFFF